MLTSLYFMHDFCDLVHTDVKPSNLRVGFWYKEMQKQLNQELSDANELVQFRSKELQSQIKLTDVKKNIESGAKLSKKDRKKLKKKIKHIEKKV